MVVDNVNFEDISEITNEYTAVNDGVLTELMKKKKEESL